jgi:hypothetical protein
LPQGASPMKLLRPEKFNIDRRLAIPAVQPKGADE